MRMTPMQMAPVMRKACDGPVNSDELCVELQIAALLREHTYRSER
jgi:hypothetical protein